MARPSSAIVRASLVILVAASAGAAPAQAQPPAASQPQDVPVTRWSFELDRAATTSAGVYDTRGRLLRTLWRGEPLQAGRHHGQWDGRDDHGEVAALGSYEMRVVHHQMRYVWEGVIGNSSLGTTQQTHRAYLPPRSIVIVGDQAYYAVGYNEQQPGLQGFALQAPQHNTRPLAAKDTFTSMSMVATDGQRLYWANTGGLSRTSFVGVYDMSPMRPAAFTSGQTVCLFYRAPDPRCQPEQHYPSVIDVETQGEHVPTGLAVQRSGRVLAVAHGSHGVVRLFDKLSGARLGEIRVPLATKALNQIAFTPSGDLWVISGQRLHRYADVGAAPRLAFTLDAGLVRPIAVAASPQSESIWVADGGASQQVKQFHRDGRAGLIIGLAGGYANDPAVRPDRLCFRSRESYEETSIAQAADSTLWVIDQCNNRMLRFNLHSKTPGVADEQVAYLPGLYASTVDHGNPLRVFANFLEFEADPDGPWQRGRSWRLVRNWLGGLPQALRDKHAFNTGYGGFKSVETLSNGRTYGIVDAFKQQVVVELPVSGPLRVVRVLAPPLPQAMPVVLYENGDLGHAHTTTSTQTALRRALTGFDSDGNPSWGEPVALASVPALPGTPYTRINTFGLPPRFPVTASGRVIFFDPSIQGNEGFHLGAALRGGNEWVWQASPTGPLDGKGSFQTKAIDGWLQYGGNSVWAHGRHVLYGYHGEFYKDMQTQVVGQANQFMHFDESGLFLGQFGHPSTRPPPPDLAGVSGNAFCITLVRIADRLYLYHNDEFTHSGVHRWRIDGWNDVHDLRATARTGGEFVLR